MSLPKHPFKGVLTLTTSKPFTGIYSGMFTLGRVNSAILILPRVTVILPTTRTLSARHVPFLRNSRLKSGLSTNHPLRADECRAIRAWLTVREKMKPETKTLFVSARRGALSRKTAWLAIRQYGEAAKLEIAAHPHMLRHACGFALADQGADTRLIQDYLGH
jgi:integrase